jgi:hypothetical protein
LAFLLHGTFAVLAVVVLAVLNASTMRWAFRDARAGIRRNTTTAPTEPLDIGL